VLHDVIIFPSVNAVGGVGRTVKKVKKAFSEMKVGNKETSEIA